VTQISRPALPFLRGFSGFFATSQSPEAVPENAVGFLPKRC
jgi:hypothetical protein